MAKRKTLAIAEYLTVEQRKAMATAEYVDNGYRRYGGREVRDRRTPDGYCPIGVAFRGGVDHPHPRYGRERIYVEAVPTATDDLADAIWGACVDRYRSEHDGMYPDTERILAAVNAFIWRWDANLIKPEELAERLGVAE